MAESVIKESLITAVDGKEYLTNVYNLDAILSVGYRVRSPRGTQFRRWATTVLREYLVKGFAMDDARLKQAEQWDYFDEWLVRIRDIRASEKRFYQKVRDLYATAIDYNKKSEQAEAFFKKVQNRMLWSVTGKTAADYHGERLFCPSSARDNYSHGCWRPEEEITLEMIRRGVDASESDKEEPEVLVAAIHYAMARQQ